MTKRTSSIAIVLVFTMLINTFFPMQSFATQNLKNSVTNESIRSTPDTPLVEESEKPEAKILGELTEKREQNVKHFLKDDFSYEAAIFNEAVHYLENGKWKEIDNSLMDTTDEENNNVLENRHNDIKIKISKNTASSKLVRLQKEKYELSWNLEGADKVTANKKELNLSRFNLLSENDKKRSVIKNKSEVSFNSVFPNTDIEYIISGNTFKENIILNKAPVNDQYTFNITTKNLIPILQEDKSIIFFDENDENNAVFKMPAPFMYDAEYIESKNIKVNLNKTNNGYKLSLMPDQDWLKSPERVYPVVIDPVISTSLDKSDIDDTWVSSGLPDENRDSSVLLGVGYGSISKITRTYIKFELPTLTTADLITDAKLYLFLYSAQPNTRQINVHRVSENWNSATTTWNNDPDYNSTVEDYAMINGSAYQDFSWNVTGMVKDWYNTGNNYGLMLKNQDESAGYNEFFSSDTSGTYEPYRAQVIISYVNNSGLESFWTYHSQDVGRAGTGYVNDYNGNLVFIHNDLAMNGNRLPLNLNHVYNSNDKDLTIGYGYGWRLNLSQTIVEDTIEGTLYYIYTDEDGTKHHFKYDSARGAIVDELSPTEYTLTKNGDGTYVIKDKKNNQLKFNASGELSVITDNNGNTMSLSYQNGKLKTITDGAGRVTTLDINQGGYLLGIIDPSNRRTSFGYNGVQLTTITYPDGTQTSYQYDGSSNKLINASYNNGYKITYEYYDTAPYRVKKVLETHADGTLGNELNISYGYNTTFFTDVKGRKDTYIFNNWGNTISTRDSQGKANYTQYYDQGDPNKNKVNLASKIQQTTPNYLMNHNAEFDSDWGFNNDISSLATGEYSTADKYLGQRSWKITKTNSSARSYFQQPLTLEKGKTYTLSGYIKTSGISNDIGEGAHLLVHYKNSSGGWEQTTSSFVSETSDWGRYEVTFTIPADASSADAIARIAIAGETGTAYFDSLQLEDGQVANRYNLVENASFEFGTGIPLFWNANAESEPGDTSVDTESAFGTRSVKINGVQIRIRILTS